MRPVLHEGPVAVGGLEDPRGTADGRGGKSPVVARAVQPLLVLGAERTQGCQPR